MLGCSLGRYGISFGTYSAQIADSFDTASGAARLGVEAQSKNCRSSPEGASNMSPSCVGAQPNDSHSVSEPLPKHTYLKELSSLAP